MSKRAGELYLVLLPSGFRLALHRAALRERLRSAPIDQGRGRRRRDLLVAAACRAKRRSSTATASRPAIMFTSATWLRANVAALDALFVGAVNIGTGIETDVVTIFKHLRRSRGQRDRSATRPGETGRAAAQLYRCGSAPCKCWAGGLRWRSPKGFERTAAYYREALAR